MTTRSGRSATLRPEIVTAWRRAELSGLNPGSEPAEDDVSDIDRESRLMVAARPVLDEVEQQLAGTRFSVLLADRESRIVDRRFGHLHLARALDGVLAVPGNRYCEETTGTNALASAFETRREFAVHGEEHFLERLKGFTCHGCPIVHPVTGRIEGVLDVTGYAQDASALLRTVATFAAHGIGKQLANDAGLRRQAMLDAYQRRTARTRRPVVVFGEGLTLSNDAASELLDGTTRTVLQDLAGHVAPRGSRRGRVALPSGVEVDFDCSVVDGAPRAVLVELLGDSAGHRTIPRGRAGDHLDRDLAAARRDRKRVLISGEAGTGRTRAAALLTAEQPVLALSSDDVAGADVGVRIAGHRGPIVIEHLHLLDDKSTVGLEAVLDEHPSSWVIATSAPLGTLRGEQRGLAARFSTKIELTPLRYRRGDIPALARRILDGVDPSATTRLAPAAMRALLRWSWPGNVLELASVLRDAATRRPGHDLRPEDLGLDLRTRRTAGERPLTPLEQVQAETIQIALRCAGGNKSRAAAELGISRTTLYRRALELGLDT